ncbi:MAG: rod shape-determining protein MreD [Pseudomonadota bacterium]
MMPYTTRTGTGAVVASFGLAIVLAIIPLPEWLRYLRPEWVTLMVIFWSLAVPGRINVGTGWILGLIIDILYGTLIGQHALALAVVSFITARLHQQIRIYPMWQQALSVFTLVALNQLLVVWVKGIAGQPPKTWFYWVPSLTSALIWPWLYIFMREIQRRYKVMDERTGA